MRLGRRSRAGLLIGVALGVAGLEDVRAEKWNSVPSARLPSPACKKFYGKFRGRDDFRICYGTDEVVSVFKTDDIVNKGIAIHQGELVLGEGTTRQTLTGSVNNIMLVSKGSQELLLANMASGDSTIVGFPNVQVGSAGTRTPWSWKMSIGDGLHVRSMSLVHLKSDAVTIAVGTDNSSIKLFNDVQLDTGSARATGELSFDTDSCPGSRRRRGTTRPSYKRRVEAVASASDWVAAASISDGCGVSLYSKAAVEAALSGAGPQAPTATIGGRKDPLGALSGPIYGVIELRNGSLAIAMSTDDFRGCKLIIYDVTDIKKPALLGSRIADKAQCSAGLTELDDGSVMIGVSLLTGRDLSRPVVVVFTPDEVLYTTTPVGLASETNAFMHLQKGPERMVVGTDNSILVYDVDPVTNKAAFCKVLDTGGIQSKSFEELADGSLAAGTSNGTVFLYAASQVQGACDVGATPVFTLSGIGRLDVDDVWTLEDDTVIVFKNDKLLVFAADRVRIAMTGEGTLAPSSVVTLPGKIVSSPPPLLVGNHSAVFALYNPVPDNVLCVLNLAQVLADDDTKATCEYVNVTGDPNAVMLAPSGDDSFIAFQPGAAAGSWKDAENFTVQRFGFPSNGVRSMDRLNGTMGAKKRASVVELWGGCVAVLLDSTLFLHRWGAEDVATLEFPSRVNWGKVVGSQEFAVAVGYGDDATLSSVYLLTDADLRGCGDDATLAGAKGYDLADADRADALEKLSDGSTVIAVDRDHGYRSILVFPDGPSRPFARSSLYLNPQLKDAAAVDVIEEYINPKTNQHSLLIHAGLTSGAIWRADAAFDRSVDGEPVDLII